MFEITAFFVLIGLCAYCFWLGYLTGRDEYVSSE